jgi:hypothetical protein
MANVHKAFILFRLKKKNINVINVNIKMKRFVQTKLFLTLQDASQKGIDKNAKVLQHDYDKFVESVFQGRAAFTDKAAYHDALSYIRVELVTLPGVSGKKCGSLSA